MRSAVGIGVAAGVLEGEGCFRLKKLRTRKTTGHQLNISMHMTDRDVVERVHRTLGFGGSVRKGGPYAPSKKFRYSIETCSSRAVGIMMTIYGLMGQRRQAKIRELLAIWKANPRMVGREVLR